MLIACITKSHLLAFHATISGFISRHLCLDFSEKVKVLIRALNGSVAAVDGGFAEYDTFAQLKFTSTKSDPECVFRKAYISRIRTNDPVHWIWHPALPKGFPAQFLTSPPGAR